jgi:tRNA (guanine37-N1)-methyltransferase
MVMCVEPTRSALRAATAAAPVESRRIYLGAEGERLGHRKLAELATLPGLVLLAGRYEGVDERLLESEVDERISIGDYVLSGGELAALVMIDGIVRLLPGALGDADSAREDSFFAGLLDWPHYTRPESLGGRSVPDVLMGGNHAAIERWRRKEALRRTYRHRPDLLRRACLNAEQRSLLDEAIADEPRCERSP